jgi:hypothetical protein
LEDKIIFAILYYPETLLYDFVSTIDNNDYYFVGRFGKGEMVQ